MNEIFEKSLCAIQKITSRICCSALLIYFDLTFKEIFGVRVFGNVNRPTAPLEAKPLIFFLELFVNVLVIIIDNLGNIKSI